jgi:VEFS-Box of polycomb protein
LLDEFTDVSESEKKFFKLWNTFVSSQQQHCHDNNDNNRITYICNKTLPRLLHLFVQQYSSILVQDDQQDGNKLSEEWIKHLANLWDEGQLNRNDMVDVMQHYTEMSQNIATTAATTTAAVTTMTTKSDGGGDDDDDVSATSSFAESCLSV